MGWPWHQLNHMQAICTSIQKITMPAPHQSDFFYGPGALPDTQPTASKHWRPLNHWRLGSLAGMNHEMHRGWVHRWFWATVRWLTIVLHSWPTRAPISFFATHAFLHRTLGPLLARTTSCKRRSMTTDRTQQNGFSRPNNGGKTDAITPSHCLVTELGDIQCRQINTKQFMAPYDSCADFTFWPILHDCALACVSVWNRH